LKFTWPLRAFRTARKTDFDTDIIFEAGEKIGVYLRDQGVNPDRNVFTMYLQVMENNYEEVKDAYTDEFGLP
jgi:hypothetical protein